MARQAKVKPQTRPSGQRTPKLHFIKPGDSLSPRFHRLALEWEQATLNASSPDTITAHPAFRRIVSLGDAAIPLALARLRQNPGDWPLVLRHLAGMSPVAEADRGNMPKMVKAWIAWGKANGHIA